MRSFFVRRPLRRELRFVFVFERRDVIEIRYM